MTIQEQILIAKVIRVFRSCQTRQQFEVAKRYATLAAGFMPSDRECNQSVLQAFYEARQQTLSK